MPISNPADIAAHTAISDAHHTLPSLPPAGKLTVAHFQIHPATGDFGGSPANLNNNDYVGEAVATAVSQYAEVYFYALMRMTQFRQYGNTPQNEDGRWKIQYLDATGSWVDWVVNIPTRAAESFGGWDSSGGEVTGIAIRLICTTKDTTSNSSIKELEVKF